MPTEYDREAIEHCRELYCKNGGKNFDAIEAGMQEVFPNWSKQNLFDRNGKKPRHGWITKHSFDKSLQEYLKVKAVTVLDDVQKRYLGIKAVCDRLEDKIKAKEDTRDDLFMYRDYCKLEMEYRLKLDLSKDSYENFVACFEKLLAWLPDIDAKAAKAFLSGDVAERLLAKAKSDYGEQETQSES